LALAEAEDLCGFFWVIFLAMAFLSRSATNRSLTGRLFNGWEACLPGTPS
jgi:hypothetical protein